MGINSKRSRRAQLLRGNPEGVEGFQVDFCVLSAMYRDDGGHGQGGAVLLAH